MTWTKTKNDRWDSDIGIVIQQERGFSVWMSLAIRDKFNLRNRVIANTLTLKEAFEFVENRYKELINSKISLKSI